MPFGIRHDAGDEHAGLRRIKVADRQTRDMLLHALAHVGDGALRGDTQHLGEGERANGLNQSRSTRRQRQRDQQVALLFDDHIVNQVLRSWPAGPGQPGG